jgi:hypothetical protein
MRRLWTAASFVAHCRLLKVLHMSNYLRNLTLTAWGVFLVVTLMNAVPVYLGLMFLVIAVLAESVLLIRYYRVLAQWRVLLLCWAIYICCQWMTTWYKTWTILGGSQFASAATVLTVETLTAGLAVMVALAVRRDVSMAYISLSLIGGVMAIYLSVQSAGSVLNFFVDLTREATQASIWSGSLLIGLSFMGAIGVLSFFPHMLLLAMRELRGNDTLATFQRIVLVEKWLPVWNRQIMVGLAHRATVSLSHLTGIPEDLRDDVLRRYQADHTNYDLVLRPGALRLGPEALGAKKALSAWYRAQSVRETEPEYLATVMPELLECSGAVLGTELIMLEASDDWYGCLLDISHVFF